MKDYSRKQKKVYRVRLVILGVTLGPPFPSVVSGYGHLRGGGGAVLNQYASCVCDSKSWGSDMSTVKMPENSNTAKLLK